MDGCIIEWCHQGLSSCVTHTRERKKTKMTKKTTLSEHSIIAGKLFGCSVSFSQVQASRAFWSLERSDRCRRRRYIHITVESLLPRVPFMKLSRNLEIRDPVIYASGRVTFRAKSAFSPSGFSTRCLIHACIFVYNVKQILNSCSN